MINLRFHIVSLVAVFLALAIGIAVGATVVDQGLVSQSQRRITSLDETLKDRAATITDLRGEVAGLNAFGAQAEPRMVRGRLLPTPVLLIANGPLDESSVRDLLTTLRASGARLLGSLDVAPSLASLSPTDLDRVRLAVEATSERPTTVRFLLRQRVIGAIATPFDSPSLASLVAFRLVSTKGFDGGAAPIEIPVGTRVVFLPAGSPENLTDATVQFLDDLASAGVPTLVAGGPDDPIVKQVRSKTILRTKISTVDDLDTIAGRVGVVYALEDLGRSIVGHYGTGKDAKRLLPAA